MAVPNNQYHPLKRLASEFKPLHDGDYFRDGKVVHITNIFQRAIQWIIDLFHGGKTTCDQKAFIDLCKTQNLEALTKSLYDSFDTFEKELLKRLQGVNDLDDVAWNTEKFYQENLSQLMEISQQTKWLLKVKAHMVSSGMIKNILEKQGDPKGEDPKAFYEKILGQDLEAFAKRLSRRLDEVNEGKEQFGIPDSLHSTLLKAKRWIDAADNQKRLLVAGETGQIPYSIKEVAPGSIMLFDPTLRLHIRELFHKHLGEKPISFFNRTQALVGNIAHFLFGQQITHAMAKTDDGKVIHIKKSQDVFPYGLCAEEDQYHDLYDHIILQPNPSIQCKIPAIVAGMQDIKDQLHTSVASLFYQIILAPKRKPEEGALPIDKDHGYTCSGFLSSSYAAQGIQLVDGIHPQDVAPWELLKSRHLYPISFGNEKAKGLYKDHPADFKEVLHTLFVRGVISADAYLALTAATISKRSFRELSIELLETLNPEILSENDRNDLLCRLQNNQFKAFYDHLEALVPKSEDYAKNLLHTWISELPAPITAGLSHIEKELREVKSKVEAGDSKGLHKALVAYFKKIVDLKNELDPANIPNYSRNDIYFALAWLEELEKVTPSKTLVQLPKLLEKEKLFRSLNGHLAEFKKEILNKDLDKINELLANLGIDCIIYDTKETSMKSLIDLLAHFYVQSLYHYKAVQGQDWIYSFYYGEFVEKFQALSTAMRSHQWCGHCHNSQTVKKRTDWPSTIYEHSTFKAPNKILTVEQDHAAEDPVNGSVMICTISFGSGHNTATAATAAYLHKLGYHTYVADNSLDTFLSDDILYVLGKEFGWSKPALFNAVIRNRMYALNNTLTAVVKIPYQVFNIPGAHNVARYNHNPEFLSQEKNFLRKAMMLRSDVIVASYQLDLNYMRKIAQLLALPLIYLSTDMSTKVDEVFTPASFFYLESMPLPNEDLRIAVPYKDKTVEDTAKTLIDNGHKGKLFYSGYPVDAAYLKTHDIPQLKRDLLIDDDCAVALIMSGGEGSNVPYPELLSEDPSIDKKMRLIVVAGKNNDYVHYLEKKGITRGTDGLYRGKNPNITISVVEERGSERRSDFPYFLSPSTVSSLYAVSDAVITKPGGGSVAQALYMRRKILIDGSLDVFEWEKFNADQIASWGLSSTFNNGQELAAAIWSAKEEPIDTSTLDNILVDPREAISTEVNAALQRSKAKFNV